MHILEKLQRRVMAINTLLCVGLDSDVDKIPARYHHNQFDFNRHIIELTHEYVCAFKPNMAFYEARGDKGWHDLALTMDHLRKYYPDIVTICDAKRGDIGSTNGGYVKAIFEDMGFDAVTLNPYLGREALIPFLKHADKGCIILCRTSNPGAGELQDLMVEGGIPLWQMVGVKVRDEWNANQNCMLVVGATYPEELRYLRHIAPDMPFLVPGVGAQGAEVERTVTAGIRNDGGGLIISASRSIIFDDNPAAAARDLRDEINRYRTF